jgi:LmbE family N-acetylglucosaminyl deacetylase
MSRPSRLLAIYTHPNVEAFGAAGTFEFYAGRGEIGTKLPKR